MNRLGYRALLGATTALLAGVYAPAASAQTTYYACRVPGVNVIYLRSAGADPCLDAAHVQFQWAEGGAPGANTVNSAAIIDGTIAAADIGTDAVGADELAAAAILNADLGSGTPNATTFLRGDRTWAAPASETATQLAYSTSATATSAFTEAAFRTIGTFTKAAAGTAITATWTSHIRNGGTAGTNFCQFELRIDDTVPTGHSSGFSGAILYGGDQAVSLTGRWTGLTAGVHTVSLWLRGNGGSCTDNFGNFARHVNVIER